LNQRRRERMVALVERELERVGGGAVAMLGLAFKPDSDDVRDSPALWAAGQLQLKGADVGVYDPRATGTASARFPTLSYADSAIEVCRGADLVLHLTEWPEFRKISPSDLDGVVARPAIFDGRNALDLDTWRSAGWTARALGRR